MITVTVESVELAEMVDTDGEKPVEVAMDRELEGPEIVVVRGAVVVVRGAVVVVVLVLPSRSPDR